MMSGKLELVSVLVVADNLVVRERLAMGLGEEGAVVHECGATASDLAPWMRGRPIVPVDVVLVDLDARRGAGIEVALAVLMAPHFATANLTSTKTLTTTNAYALYMGKAPRSLTSVQARYRVTTAAATITWAELAIAKGSVSIGAGMVLIVVGFADISAVINSAGQKSTVVNVSSGQAIDAGDDLWLLIGNQATTAAVVRAQSVADDLQVGLQGVLAARPSSSVGTPAAFGLESATTLAAWAALVI